MLCVKHQRQKIETEKKKNSLNKLAHLIGGEGKGKPKYSTTQVIWPKLREDLIIEIASNVQENAPELLIQRNQTDDQDSNKEEDDSVISVNYSLITHLVTVQSLLFRVR